MYITTQPNIIHYLKLVCFQKYVITYIFEYYIRTFCYEISLFYFLKSIILPTRVVLFVYFDLTGGDL